MPSEPKLPAINTDIACRVSATRVRLSMGETNFETDLNGELRYRILEDPDDPHAVRIKVTKLHLYGTPAGMRLELGHRDAFVLGHMKQIQDSPPTFELRLAVACTAVLSMAVGEPLVATAKDPLVLTTNTMTAGSPNGETFTLEEAAEFFKKDQPDAPAIRIPELTAKLT